MKNRQVWPSLESYNKMNSKEINKKWLKSEIEIRKEEVVDRLASLLKNTGHIEVNQNQVIDNKIINNWKVAGSRTFKITLNLVCKNTANFCENLSKIKTVFYGKKWFGMSLILQMTEHLKLQLSYCVNCTNYFSNKCLLTLKWSSKLVHHTVKQPSTNTCKAGQVNQLWHQTVLHFYTKENNYCPTEKQFTKHCLCIWLLLS